jgi:hypothetical protein
MICIFNTYWFNFTPVDFLKDHGIGIHMIAGDFNETLKEIDRRSNSSKTKYQTVNSLKTLLKTNDLIDIWRELNSNFVLLLLLLLSISFNVSLKSPAIIGIPIP